jgi:hypothetical protein
MTPAERLATLRRAIALALREYGVRRDDRAALLRLADHARAVAVAERRRSASNDTTTEAR